MKLFTRVFKFFLLITFLSVWYLPVPSYAQTAQMQKISPAPNDYKIKVYYFYARGEKANRKYIKEINPFLEDIRKWYVKKTGKTLTIKPVKVIRGKYRSDYYEGEDFWVKIMEELGLNCGTKDISVIFLGKPIFRGMAASRSCGAWYAANNNGDAWISETVLEPDVLNPKTGKCSNGAPFGNWNCSPNASRGLVAHELGHTLSLNHPPGCDGVWESYCGKTIMWAWWYWPKNGFIEEAFAPEKSTLGRSPWLK